MTLEEYIKTTPKGFYLLIEGPNKAQIPVQDFMANERRWRLYRNRIVGAVDSIDPPDGYDYASIIRIERGFHLWCKDSS